MEVINLLRPTVAISVFITLAAHALHRHPECRQKLQAGEAGYADFFVQEVRRFYPFFPAVMARARRDFEWRGYRFDMAKLPALPRSRFVIGNVRMDGR